MQKKMKKIFLTLFALHIGFYTFCQVSNYGTDDFNSIQVEFYTNYSDTIQDTNYLKTIKQFKRWEQFWGPRLTGYNSLDSITHKSMKAYAQMQSLSNNNDHSNWVELGPNINGIYGIGRIDAIAIDYTNSNIIYAGSPSGGLWKTTDGGSNWFNISDNYFSCLGISSIAIDQSNNNIIYAATGDVDSETTYSHGVYKSTDGGSSWKTINSGLIYPETPHFTIGKILLHPTNNTAFLATSEGIYKCSNRNQNTPQWFKVEPAFGNEYFRNICFKPGNPSTLYAVGIDIITSNDNGVTWDRFATASNGLDFSGTPWPNALNGYYIQMMNMAIDPNGNYIYVNGVVRESEPPYNWQSYVDYKLWCYDIENDIWSTKNAWYDDYSSVLTVGRNEMVVSPIDSEHIYAGGVRLYESTNGGASWDRVYYGSRHADYHELLFDPNDNNIQFVGTDGGVWKIDLQNHNSAELNNGLGISTMYNMGSSIIDPYQVLTGSQDCGINYLKNNQWSHEYTSDGFECYMDEENINIMYATVYHPINGRLKRSTSDANNPNFYTTDINPTADNASHGAALVAHPDKTYELYQARQNIWKIPNARTGNSSDWIKISDFSTMFPNIPWGVNYALEIAPSNGDYIYTTYVDGTSWVTDNNRVKLVKTTTGGGLNSNDWIDITPDPYDGEFTYLITDIAVSDKDPNKLWVCYSGYMDNLKVKYYNGYYWINYNDGLPNVPLNTIIYYEGSDDMLFVGTDIGVFYRDNSMSQWEPFSNNLPNVIVNWLEINETNSTLRAATYGRGLWETDLICSLQGEEISINDNNVVWDTPMLVSNTLTVNDGAQLTITSEISLTPFAKIIVKPGAKLIIDGARLTNACSEAWLGIQVWGDKTAHQYLDANGNYQQGYIELKNGAVIENAWEAIQPWHSDEWNETGGIIIANGATFRNNRRAIAFLSYQNFDPQTGEPRPNQSYFSNCTFETNDDFEGLFGESPFHTFVSMWKVDGVEFLGCDFIDSRPEFIHQTPSNGVGILTIDANFYVLPRCIDAITTCWECTQTNLDPSSFTGLNIGINSSQENTLNTFVVDRTDFINNLNGIVNQANDFASCIRSEFKVGTKQTAGPYEWPIGILNSRSTDFTFDQNEFSLHQVVPSDLDGTIGIWNTNLLEDGNIIFKNSFTGFDYANMASGDNHNNDYPELGLQYRCNENNANKQYDFYVGWQIDEGIATYQGTSSKPAGNTFSHLTTPPGSDFKNIAIWPVNYYYYTGDPDQEPLNTIGVWKRGTDNENNCVDRISSGSDIRLSEAEKTAYRQQYYDNKSEYNNTKILFESMKDGGSTPSTILDIETSWPNDTWELRAQLLADSPHLSEEVLMEAASRTDVLPHTIMFEICIANPEEMRNERFLEYLATKENPMPQYMIDDLREGADEDTYKSVLQNEMSGYAYEWGEACTYLLRDIVLDSTGIEYDSLRFWLAKKESLLSEYQIVNSYLAEDDLTNALSHLNDIPNNYDISGKQLDEYNYYYDLKSTFITAQQQGRNIMQLDSLEVLDLVYIADSSKGLARAQARGLLNFAYGYNYFEKPEISVTGMKETIAQDKEFQNNNHSEEHHFVSAYPNPASQWVAFDYTLPYPAENATIIISDVSGKTINAMKVNRSYGQTVWNSQGTTSGIYFYSLEVNGNIIDKRKLIITK